MPKYYLDTGTLYNLSKLPESIQMESFYSIFGLIEIVAGIKETEYYKRRAVLSTVIKSDVACDYSFPEALIFRAFRVFDDYELKEQREDDLLGIIDDVIHCGSFAEFQNKILLSQRKFDFQYFVDLDNFYSTNFIEASKKGMAEVRTALESESSNRTVTLSGQTYDLSNRRSIVNFLNSSLVNPSITLLTLVNEVRRISLSSLFDASEEQVYSTYNGLAKYYIDAWSAYSTLQIINDQVPGRNDFQDLLHLLYLRDSSEIKIITDDRIFHKCIPEKAITIQNVQSQVV